MDTADECAAKGDDAGAAGVDGSVTAAVGGGDTAAFGMSAENAASVAADCEVTRWFACTSVAATGDGSVAASRPTARTGAGLIDATGEGCSEGNSIDTETSWYSSGTLRLFVTGEGRSEGNSIDTETSWYSSGTPLLLGKDGGVAMRDGVRAAAVSDGCSTDLRRDCVVLLDDVAALGRGTVSRATEGTTAADVPLTDRCNCGGFTTAWTPAAGSPCGLGGGLATAGRVPTPSASGSRLSPRDGCSTGDVTATGTLSIVPLLLAPSSVRGAPQLLQRTDTLLPAMRFSNRLSEMDN